MLYPTILGCIVGHLVEILVVDEDGPLGMHIFVAVCIFVLAILVAYGSYRLYDLPVREWLKKKLFKAAAQKQAQ